MKQPDASHPIDIQPTGQHVTVTVNGHRVAATDRALSLRESTYPAVQYIPIEDVDASVLRRTSTQTYCPYKGEAGYYSVQTPDGVVVTDVIWEYAQPYEAVKQIAGHVAFYPDRAAVQIG